MKTPEQASLFDAEALMGAASAATGLSDFGDPVFLEPLEIYLKSLDTQAKLSDQGRVGMSERVKGSLVQRLMVEEWIRKYPEILDEKIERPLVIVGLPRTGTTMLYRMLSVTEGFSAPLHYEAAQPAPPFDWDFRFETDERVPQAEAAIKVMMELAPELGSIYPYEAMAPEEDIYLSQFSFRSTSMQSSARVPDYEIWLRSADRAPTYRCLRRMLQLLQWQRRKTDPSYDPGRWLLKTPDHIHGVDALLGEFPRAQIIQTHRDPLETIPSICSFIRALHSMSTEEVDSLGIGESWSTMFAQSMIRTIDIRDRKPDCFHDVWYKDTVGHPRQVAESIFDFIGMPFDEKTWAEMEKWREANRREARPSHKYTLEEFGLSEEGITELFKAYRQRFILRPTPFEEQT